MDARATEFSVAEAKASFSELLSRAEAGEEIVIRRHGKVVARLSPPAVAAASELPLADKLKAWNDWFAYRDAEGISLPEGMTIKDLIEDGRRF